MFVKNLKRKSTFVFSWKLSIKILSHAGFNWIKLIKDNGLLLFEGDSKLRIM